MLQGKTEELRPGQVSGRSADQAINASPATLQQQTVSALDDYLASHHPDRQAIIRTILQLPPEQVHLLPAEMQAEFFAFKKYQAEANAEPPTEPTQSDAAEQPKSVGVQQGVHKRKHSSLGPTECSVEGNSPSLRGKAGNSVGDCSVCGQTLKEFEIARVGAAAGEIRCGGCASRHGSGKAAGADAAPLQKGIAIGRKMQRSDIGTPQANGGVSRPVNLLAATPRTCSTASGHGAAAPATLPRPSINCMGAQPSGTLGGGPPQMIAAPQHQQPMGRGHDVHAYAVGCMHASRIRQQQQQQPAARGGFPAQQRQQLVQNPQLIQQPAPAGSVGQPAGLMHPGIAMQSRGAPPGVLQGGPLGMVGRAGGGNHRGPPMGNMGGGGGSGPLMGGAQGNGMGGMQRIGHVTMGGGGPPGMGPQGPQGHAGLPLRLQQPPAQLSFLPTQRPQQQLPMGGGMQQPAAMMQQPMGARPMVGMPLSPRMGGMPPSMGGPMSIGRPMQGPASMQGPGQVMGPRQMLGPRPMLGPGQVQGPGHPGPGQTPMMRHMGPPTGQMGQMGQMQLGPGQVTMMRQMGPTGPMPGQAPMLRQMGPTGPMPGQAPMLPQMGPTGPMPGQAPMLRQMFGPSGVGQWQQHHAHQQLQQPPRPPFPQQANLPMGQKMPLQHRLLQQIRQGHM